MDDEEVPMMKDVNSDVVELEKNLKELFVQFFKIVTTPDSRTCVKSSVEMNTQLGKMVALTDGTTIPRAFCGDIWEAKCYKDRRKRHQGNNEAIVEMDKLYRQLEASVYSSFVFGSLGVNEELVGEVDLKDFVNRSEQGDFNKEAREILFEFIDKIDVTKESDLSMRQKLVQNIRKLKQVYSKCDYTYEGRRRLMVSELDVKVQNIWT
ncbi:hypothetical protein GIB67_033675 [Kingdonia uniflora]|uniref:Uncharacterized protein n=1 Tax=Kingdonia uniflora TaxID=39325 RepID=A0A7J7P495_9MAGN|nr:hypothetical protein GIB67_033675 [Kingdonia uniflora]